MEAEVIDKILEKHPKEPGSIIQVLLDVQNELYYLPRDVLEYVSKELNVPGFPQNSITHDNQFMVILVHGKKNTILERHISGIPDLPSRPP